MYELFPDLISFYLKRRRKKNKGIHFCELWTPLFLKVLWALKNRYSARPLLLWGNAKVSRRQTQRNVLIQLIIIISCVNS